LKVETNTKQTRTSFALDRTKVRQSVCVCVVLTLFERGNLFAL